MGTHAIHTKIFLIDEDDSRRSGGPVRLDHEWLDSP